MTNPLLLSSSIIATIAHYIIYTIYNPKYQIIVYAHFLGLTTSILNHGLKHKFFKYTDRISIIGIFIIDMYILKQLYNKENKDLVHTAIIFLVLAGSLYYINKLIGVNQSTCVNQSTERILHLCAHILGTIAHIIIICIASK